jgi:glycosyltransferase involved in cell wall biosynthesis
MPKLSAIVITKNEARQHRRLPRQHRLSAMSVSLWTAGPPTTPCGSPRAKARAWCSTRSRVFGAQKNFALSLAQGEWLLSLDADERVSPQLADEILKAVAQPAADAYEMPRLSSFCGRPMRHSGWFPDYVLRLFQRGKANFSDDLVHERVVADGRVARLKNPLIHHPVLRLEDALSRMDRYSTAGADMLVASGRRVSFITGLVRGFWAFIRTYLLRGGFLDGHEGFLLAVANAEGTYYRYMKAWLKGRQHG